MRRTAGRLVSAGRRLLAVADALPVTVLAVIAGAGSFTHIRDTAAGHGQGGPMSWAVAVCVDLTCVMAARERQRDKQAGITTRRLSWPTVVLTGGILLSLAANLDQAQPTAWGRIVAAVPPAAFLVAVSMIERRAARPAAGQDGGIAEPSAPGRPSPVQDAGDGAQDGGDEALLAAARRAAAEHQDQHGQPITRDALRARLGVSNQAASGLLRQLRAGEGLPPGTTRAA
jgi:phosphatidylglycerophosphate synthase